MKYPGWLCLGITALAFLAAGGSLLCAQETHSGPWVMQSSGTTAGLRGIHAVRGGVAWASGTDGTVLRTEDGGYLWQRCAMPPGAEKLDFRGIQAWDANTAVVMSSGPGNLSRIYKTTDGCSHWKLLKTNEDRSGFWDALRLWTPTDGFLAGDPVDGHLFLTETTKYWGGFIGDLSYELPVKGKSESAFAASNSCIALGKFNTRDGTSRDVWFATGGSDGSRVIHYQHFTGGDPEREALSISQAPMFPKTSSGGIFSLAFRDQLHGMAVGGDYKQLNVSAGTAARTADGGQHWTAAEKPPHGYRSAVAWDADAKAWIAVGTNGSDISYDDGKTWAPLDNGNWNALSLPWVVGPQGRIAKLDADKLRQK